MKGLIESIQEEFVTEARKPLLYEIQGEDSKGAAYSTFNIDDAKKKYKHGFLSYSQYEGIVFAVAFNTPEDMMDLLDTDDDNYTGLLGLKPQEFKTIDGELFVCLW